MNLAELFDYYGTDKRRSGYHTTYELHLLHRRQQITAVLEAGIGTLDSAAPSSMTGYAAPHYKPGGSLRAWRDWLPNAIITGIDTQPDTQFSDDRIRTALADSTNRHQLDAALGNQTYDLIIDDADHDPRSQLHTLANLWPHLRAGGLYVIEDILGPPPNIITLTCPTT